MTFQISILLNEEISNEKDLTIPFWKMKTNFIFLICLIEFLVVHNPNLSFLSSLIKKLAKKTTLNMTTSKEKVLSLIHTKFDKDLIKTG